MQEIKLYDFALGYIGERVTQEVLEHYLTLYRHNSLASLAETFERILESVKERQGMPYAIGNLSPLRPLLYDFDPQRILANFEDWQTIFKHIQSNYVPPGRMDIDNSKSYWVIFSKSILATARFLSRFATIEEFKAYCNSFIDGNTDMRIAFPLLLSEEIKPGLGFALACNFLKEWVSPFFVKPDTHTKDIFIGTGFCAVTDSDFTICRRIIEFSKRINQTPYSVDKVFWLIGSGKLHETYSRTQVEYFPTSKHQFINLFNETNNPTANSSLLNSRVDG